MKTGLETQGWKPEVHELAWFQDDYGLKVDEEEGSGGKDGADEDEDEDDDDEEEGEDDGSEDFEMVEH